MNGLSRTIPLVALCGAAAAAAAAGMTLGTTPSQAGTELRALTWEG